MKTRFLLSVLLLFSLSGCEEDCSTVDCIQEPFWFRLLDAQGENLLDNGTLTLDQIAILVSDAPHDTLRISAYEQYGETYLEAPIDQNKTTYVLNVDGYAPLDLSFDLDVRSGDCCTSVTIEEAYVNESSIAVDREGEWFITLP